LAFQRLLLRGKVSLLTLYAFFLLLESCFLLFDSLLLSVDYLLLLIDRVYQNGGELPVFDSFDSALSFRVVKSGSIFSTSSAPKPTSCIPPSLQVNEIGRSRRTTSSPPAKVCTSV
jgi:hypothetical protein